MSSEVGAGHVSIFPVFKGLRQSVRKEMAGTVKAADREVVKGFRGTGEAAGRGMGEGLRKTFEGATKELGSKGLKTFEADVRRTSQALSRARLQEQDSLGKVRVAEARLADSRRKYSRDSAQVVAAEERLEAAQRSLRVSQERTATSTDDLRRAQNKLASAADNAGDQLEEAGVRSGRRFSTGFLTVFSGSAFGNLLANLVSNALSNTGYLIRQGIRNSIMFAVGTIDFASDLNESINAVQVAYGEASKAVLALGDDSAKSFGLSTKNLNAFAVQFSGFAANTRKDNPAAFLEELITRGTDFASVYNLEVSEALSLFQSGLAGETEPLRRFGIDLSAAAVEAHAYASGLVAAGAELSEQQKQQARYSLLLKQTNAVQGDFLNTADSLANRNRTNAATWEDLQAKIGTGFLPVATKLAEILADRVFPVIEDLVDEHGPALAKAFEDALPGLTRMAEDLLPQLPGIISSIAESLPVLMDFVTNVTPGFVAAFQAANGFFVGIQSLAELLNGDLSLQAYGERLNGLTGPMGDLARATTFLGYVITGFVRDTLAGMANFHAGVRERVQGVVTFFSQIPARIRSVFAGIGSWLFSSGQRLIGGFLDGISSMWSSITDRVGGVVDFVMGFFPNSPAKRGPLSGAGWADLKRSGSAIVGQVTAGMEAANVSSSMSRTLSRLAATSGQITATAGGTSVGSGSSLTAGGAAGGDVYNLYGLTVEETAEMIAEQVERRRRRRAARALSSAGRP